MAYDATLATPTTGTVISVSDFGAKVVGNIEALYTDSITVYSTIIVFPPTLTCEVGNSKIEFAIPAKLNGWNLTGVKGWVNTAGDTGTMTVQIENVTQSEDMLSTLLTFASGATVDNGSAAIDATKDDVATGDIISINIDTIHTTPAWGLFVELKWEKP